MVKKFLFSACVFIIACLHAQSQVAKKINGTAKFHSYNNLQLLNGSSGTAVALVSVNGFQFNRFYTGLGVGYDYYFFRSVPLFAEARYKLTKRAKTIQLFADGGANFSFDKKIPDGKYKPGIYWSAGFDYFIPVHDDAFTFGLGYSTKKVVQQLDNFIYNPVEGVSTNIPSEQVYLLNRLAIRFEWMF